jgi:phosphatidylglycerol---prolipoprotein diacylglyceryl transferase
MFIHNIDPVLFSIGPLSVRYYGLFWVVGFIIGYFLLVYLAKRKELSITKDDIADLLMYGIIGTVLGARIFYVLVYNLPFYLDNPLEIFAIWNGGLAFHGGLIGGALAILYYTRKKKIDFYEIADIAVIPMALALALGRVGNFINGEVIGNVTNVQWGVKFPDAEGFRHPSQIYASFKNLLIFFTLWIIKDSKFPRGFMFWLFVVMYSTLRFIVGFFRAPDVQLGYILGPLTTGQVLNIIMLTVGAVFLYRVYRKNKVVD